MNTCTRSKQPRRGASEGVRYGIGCLAAPAEFPLLDRGCARPALSSRAQPAATIEVGARVHAGVPHERDAGPVRSRQASAHVPRDIRAIYTATA
jgi:hypothetical protein